MGVVLRGRVGPPGYRGMGRRRVGGESEPSVCVHDYCSSQGGTVCVYICVCVGGAQR